MYIKPGLGRQVLVERNEQPTRENAGCTITWQLYHYMPSQAKVSARWSPLLASSSCFRKLTGSSLIYSSWKCGSDLQFCVYRNMCYLFCPQYNYIFCVGEEKVYVQGSISWFCLPHIFCSWKNIPSWWAWGTSLVEIRSGTFVYI